MFKVLCLNFKSFKYLMMLISLLRNCQTSDKARFAVIRFSVLRLLNCFSKCLQRQMDVECFHTICTNLKKNIVNHCKRTYGACTARIRRTHGARWQCENRNRTPKIYRQDTNTTQPIRRANVSLAQGVLDPRHTTCYSRHSYIATPT